MNTTEILTGIKAWIVDKLAHGTLTILATNIKSWAELDDLSAEDTWSGAVRTSGGDLSIISDKGGRIVSLISGGSFYASALKATGFNLLRNAVSVGTGYYILVPTMEFGTYGTAEKPNGILFTDSEGNNLTPTVRFKALSSGVPTSISDGSACAYTDSNGYRFYTTSEAGYMIVSGITLASTCAHVGWSRRYSEYIAVDDANDAGGSIALSSIISAIHSYNLMLSVTRNGSTVADSISFGDSAATWYRNVDRVQATWTTEVDSVEEGATQTYTHTATISGMKSDGAVACGSIALNVNGTTISYQDTNESATTDSVVYELATKATGTITISPNYAIEDWGLEMFEGVSGTAYVTTMYAQGYPDTLAAMASSRILAANVVIAEALNALKAEIDGLKASSDDIKTINAMSYKTMGTPNVLWSTTAGAPSASIALDEKCWDEETMGLWTGVPRFIGQIYIDKANGKVYMAKTVSGSTSDWVLLN